VLLVYAAREGHYRELAAQNELRPQDVMRILVHYHAYGDPKKVPELVAEHSGRIREQINERENGEVERLEAEYKPQADKLAKLDAEIAELQAEAKKAAKKTDKTKIEDRITKLEAQQEKLAAKIRERDARVAEARRSAEEDRKAVAEVGHELGTLYGDPDELLKHARVVDFAEIEENEFNLNVPRYVDTFEPEPRLEVKDVLEVFAKASNELSSAEILLEKLLREAGYAIPNAR
jgi:type I restriction enzyme M protein